VKQSEANLLSAFGFDRLRAHHRRFDAGQEFVFHRFGVRHVDPNRQVTTQIYQV
jgi:hypothetical protein